MKRLKFLKLPFVFKKKEIRFIFIFLILLFIPAILQAQVVTGSFEFEGKMRDYVLFLPQDYDGVSNMPLVLNLHGNYPGFDGKFQMDWTLMNTVADTAGFIVVYPTGIFQNGTNGCWYYDIADPTNGVGFIDVLLDTLNILYKINNDQIYACGHSGGGLMSCKLACELNHRISAIASEGGGIAPSIAEKVDLKRPMPFLSIHGTADPNVPYDGEPGKYSAEETVRFWVDLNICSKADTIFLPDLNPADGCTLEKITYTNTGVNTKVVFYKVINGGHTWPGSAYDIPSVGNTNRDISASEEIWNFFKHYELSKLSFPQHDMTVRTFPMYVNSVPILVNNFKPGVIVKNSGLKDEQNVAVTCEIDSSGTIIYTNTQIIDVLTSLTKTNVIFDNWYSYDVWTYGITCYTTQLNGDVNLTNDTLKGTIEVTNLIDDFEHGVERWVSDYGWGLASPSHSGNYGIFNRVLPNCTNKIETHLTSTFSFDLSSITSAELRFWTRYSFSENDSGFVEISSDSGKIWHRIGNTLVGKNLDYCLKTYSLSSYCGVGYNDIQIRFTVYNDLSNVVPIWYIDDITIHPNEDTGVKRQLISTSPAIYVLSNNYPNPFNSKTIIKYQLPRATDVKMVIYNLMGQKIKTLINKPHQPGYYEITWDGLDCQALPVTSGIYFYTLITDANIEARKMTLIK